MRFGNVEIEPGALLAPLCGVTTRPFRRICRRFGASVVYSETVSADGLFHLNARTLDLARFHPEERPIGVQIFGCDVEKIAVAARIVEDMTGPDLIDLNFGCPVPKFTKNDKGAALLKNPSRIRAIVAAVVRSVRTPVTAKIRAGWNDQSIVAAEIARIVEGEGAVALTVHGRTRTQGYRGEANWDWIADAVRAVSIPVIGNGDVVDGEGASARIAETGCAGIMIGRGAIGNPWIFRDVAARLAGRPVPGPPTNAERLAVMLDHLRLQLEDRGELVGIREFRRQLCQYVKGLPDSAAFRQWATRTESPAELEEGLVAFLGTGVEREAAYGS